MKTLALILFLFFPIYSFALGIDLQKFKKTEFSLTCVTTLPTTSFFVESDDKKQVNVNLINHNGVQYMPIHSGLVVTNDFEFLKNKSEILAIIGTDAKFQFPEENCDPQKGKLLSCRKGNTQTIAGHEVVASHLFTSLKHEETVDLKWDRVELNLGLTIDGRMHYITMQYEPHECRVFQLSKY